MTNTALTILDLNDIVEPSSVGLWPLAPIPLMLLLLGFSALLFTAGTAWIRWHRNAYRREALRLLNNTTETGATRVLLKRVALAAWPREMIAPLYGNEWIDFLNGSCGRSTFKAGMEFNELSAQAVIWIKHHRRPDAC